MSPQYALWTGLATLAAPAWLGAVSLSRRLRLPLSERLGFVPDEPDTTTTRILFHAASGGDVRAVAPVVAAVREIAPHADVWCTVQTRSAVEMARRISLQARVTALPLDGWPWVDRFVARLQPDVLVLEYLEVWPRLARCVRRHGGRVALQNARVHPDRMASYRSIWAAPIRHVLRTLDLCTARSEADALRLGELGATVDAVHPHTKHALTSPPDRRELRSFAVERGLGGLQRRSTWIAGSLHRDEIDTVVRAHATVLQEDRSTVLIVAPRYPVRDADLVCNVAREHGLSVRRIGEPDGEETSPAGGCERPHDVLVVTTMGELATWYGLADVALVGGTLGERGGQNPVEPSSAGCRVLVGPRTKQIESELGWVGGVTRVAADASELAWSVRRLMTTPSERGPHRARTPASDPFVLARRATERLAVRIVGLARDEAPGSLQTAPPAS